MNFAELQPLGWTPYFQQQLTLDESEHCVALRVSQLRRTDLRALGENGERTVEFPRADRWSELVTVGDWILASEQGDQAYLERVLERSNGFVRKAAGTQVGEQWISANLDYVFVVMPCTDGFSVNRVERYLALAAEGQVEPVVILTRADECDDVDALLDALPRQYPSHAVDGRSEAARAVLEPYLAPGRTIAFVGSSGVGKSTLINTLAGDDRMLTGAIREGDGKGRHTTTWRELTQLPDGALVIDTPGMRELQLTGLDAGIEALFGDIEEIAVRCKFRDCAHAREPGCAVRKAIEDGEIEERRLTNYLKMLREQAYHDRELRSHHEIVAERKQWTSRVKSSTRAKSNLRNTSFDT